MCVWVHRQLYRDAGTGRRHAVSFLCNLLQRLLQGETCGHSVKSKGAVGFLTVFMGYGMLAGDMGTLLHEPRIALISRDN